MIYVLIVIPDSGHGSEVEDTDGDEHDGRDEGKTGSPSSFTIPVLIAPLSSHLSRKLTGLPSSA